MTRLSLNHLLICALAGAFPAVLAAQTITVQLEREVIYGDEEVSLYVNIAGTTRGLGAPRLERVDGLVIRGPSKPSRQEQWVNGRRSRSTLYRFLLKPDSTVRRSYTVGPVTVPRRGGPPLKSRRLTLTVYRKPPTGVKVRREVSGTSGPTLSPFRVTYTVYYSGQRQDEVSGRDAFDLFSNRTSPFGLAQLDLPILKRTEVKLFPIKVLDDREFKRVRIDNESQIFVQQSATELDGFGYQTLVFGFQVVPLRAGPLEIAPAEVGLNLVARWEIGTDIFRRRVRRPVVEMFRGASTAITYEVRNPPLQGRPASYNGAVGKYSIVASASPTDVDAFTPIKLEVRVRCDSPFRSALKKAILENLSAPRWSREESLTRNFDVSSDLHPGVVEDDSKVFTQTIRPLGDHVKEVPPIPFPYYDPDTQRYAVAYSRPITLNVRAVNTVDGGDAIRNTANGSPEAVRATGTSPTVSIVEQSGIAANFRTIGTAQASLDPRAEIMHPRFLGLLLGPPAVFGLVVLARRGRRDPRRVIRDKALSRAMSRLAHEEDEAGEGAAAFQDYFRDRLALAAGELTPGDLHVALDARGVPGALQKSATRLLEQFLSARFGGGGRAARELSEDARLLLKELDPCLR